MTNKMSADCCLRPRWRQPCPGAAFGDIKLGHTRPFYGDASPPDYVLTPKQSPLSVVLSKCDLCFLTSSQCAEFYNPGLVADLLSCQIGKSSALSLCPTHMVSRVFLAFTFYDRYWTGRGCPNWFDISILETLRNNFWKL